MTYLNGQILKSLKEARQRKGFSQRELSAKSGVPQSHISKIESGVVDLRVSSLIALARVLDLELELVPKKTVPAIKSIVRSSANADVANMQKQTQREVERYKKTIASMPEITSLATSDLEKLRKAAAEMGKLTLDSSAIKAVVSSRKALEGALKQYSLKEGIGQSSGIQEAVRMAARQMSSIRRSPVHSNSVADIVEANPAYSLDGGDDE